jgi:cytosine/creatinine deaminase
MTGTALPQDHDFMKLALAQARKSHEEGGIPVGAVMVRDGRVIAEGHNQRVQRKNPILHGEMDCLQNYGRAATYRGVTLYTTLNPCMMRAGTIVQFGIERVVIGQEKVLFPPEHPFHGNLDFLGARGVDAALLNDPGCEALFAEFLADPKTRALWLEDIGIVET